jgi:outer membrane protein TolC
VASIEAQVRAGAGRLAELREAKLLQLDADIAINRIDAQRDQLIERLSLEYDLGVDDAAHYLQVYLQNRPEPLRFLEAAETSQARALRLQIAAADYEERQIKGSRYMQIDGVVDGTVFGLADYEDEYEVTARLEFRMPLYDGGTASARLRKSDLQGKQNEMESLTANFKAKAAAELVEA